MCKAVGRYLSSRQPRHRRKSLQDRRTSSAHIGKHITHHTATVGIVQETFGIIQGTIGTVQGTFGNVQGTFSNIQETSHVAGCLFLA
jgi:ribosomal protein L35AE/L33A